VSRCVTPCTHDDGRAPCHAERGHHCSNDTLHRAHRSVSHLRVDSVESALFRTALFHISPAAVVCAISKRSKKVVPKSSYYCHGLSQTNVHLTDFTWKKIANGIDPYCNNGGIWFVIENASAFHFWLFDFHIHCCSWAACSHTYAPYPKEYNLVLVKQWWWLYWLWNYLYQSTVQ